MIACMRVTGWSEALEPPGQALLEIAQMFSPRMVRVGADAVAIDLDGLERLLGDARTIGEELRRAAADRGMQVRIAVAGTRLAAELLTLERAGLVVVAPGGEAASLASLPVDLLGRLDASAPSSPPPPPSPPARFYRSSPVQELVRPRRRTRADATRRLPELETLRRWGVRTLGALAALPPDELAARLGVRGPLLQAMARGEEIRPLVPHTPEEVFEETLALEWPIEGLEPLSFVLGRLFEPLCAHLHRRGRAAAVLHVELRLVSRETWARRLALPAPVKDPRVLRTLALLDLESSPPPAGIDAVSIRAEPAPARTTQFSLIQRARPAPEQITTLLARLKALLGESRVGRPVLCDTYRPGAFEMAAFAAAGDGAIETERGAPPGPALRRFRRPIPARVAADEGRPVHVQVSRPGVGGRVTAVAGPWRTSGEWWQVGPEVAGWDRDEWEVALDSGTVCRIFRDRARDRWFVDAVID